ncbi:CAP domain-containing protein [Siminovitchia acidinfaciens]|uniref:CAP domain-containing protein n=1 Tax=Siminovitchia acidinfaciens TaxID=2321395 RepID=UPI001F306801|nr:CAP domain-containing protein [Siminovitchia acidinfaciens]
MIGSPVKELVEAYGEPDRKDPSAYGYEWWIYNEKLDSYMQAGIQNGKVVTIYAVGRELDISPFKTDQSIEDIYRSTILETEIVVNAQEGTYRFELSEEDLNIRPLIQLGDIFAQLSIDKFTGSLFSVRFLDKKTLISHRPYELVYRGDLNDPKDPDENDWRPIERGSEKQIFDITNIFRMKFDLTPLRWDEEVAEVAYGHSKDMSENDYFAHDSPVFGDLSKRLKHGDIHFQTAGENIAAEYIDGPAAVEGWLNSENHRKALLEKDFTLIGVGVYKKQYTQNFIKPTEL